MYCTSLLPDVVVAVMRGRLHLMATQSKGKSCDISIDTQSKAAFSNLSTLRSISEKAVCEVSVKSSRKHKGELHKYLCKRLLNVAIGMFQQHRGCLLY